MTVVTRWWWIRHAPVRTDGGRLYGQRDLPADTSDEAAFRMLAAGLPQDALWITSQLQRTHQTAAAIFAAGLGGVTPLVVEDFIEQGFGDWQGQPRAELFADSLKWPGYWMAPVHEAPPGGESFVQVTDRVGAAIDQLSREHAGRHIVVVAHGGSIRAAISKALGLAPEIAGSIAIDNLSVTRLTHIAEKDPVADTTGAGGRVAWRIGGINLPPFALRGPDGGRL